MGLSVKQRELGGTRMCEGWMFSMCLCMHVRSHDVCVCVCVSGIKVGGLPVLFLEWTMTDEMRGNEQIFNFFLLCHKLNQTYMYLFFFYSRNLKAFLVTQEQHRLNLEVRAHIPDRDEGPRATLSGCSRPSSLSYIVNEQKRERKNEKQHRSGCWRAGWDDIIPIPKPPESRVSLPRWETWTRSFSVH